MTPSVKRYDLDPTKKYTITKWIKSPTQPHQDIFTKERAKLKLKDLQSVYPLSETRFEIEEVQE